MRLRYAGTTVDVKLASAKAWAFCSVMLFVFSTVYFLSQARHGRKAEPAGVPGQELKAPVLEVPKAAAYQAAESDSKDGALKFEPLVNLKGYRFDSEVEDVKMAMVHAKGRYMEILKMQRDILKKQDRPPDTHYNINITLSDKISMDRKIEDTRPPICRTFSYDKSILGKASVIIPFYNEALSMLLRTVHSILNTSPDDLLHEVILVDDCSTREYLMDSFSKYLYMLPKVRIIRNKAREGLIKSRLIGSRSTDAPVVIFLDAHTEANVGWLEPLLDELRRHPASVIQPFVDGIEAMTIQYSSPPSLHKGTFSWDLGYRWQKLSDHEAARSIETGYPFFSPTLVGCAIAVNKTVYRWQKLSDHEAARSIETGYPFFSPTLVGCAIAVNKKYFEHIGEFDEGLKVWGGENIELAFRAWMCGGRVVTVICSRVGHVFKNFPYKFDGNREQIVSKNLMRVTETWMDGFRKFYYATARLYDFKRAEFDKDEIRSLAERIELRKRLKCENFEWYMHNIAPDVEVPPMDATYYGEIGSLKTHACWELTPDYYVGMNYLCYEHKIIPKNYFHINHRGQLKYRDKCIRIEPPKPALRLGECPGENEDLKVVGVWEVVNMGQTWGLLKVSIRNAEQKIEEFCVIQVTNVFVGNHNKEQMPQITRCDKDNEFQMWAWTYRFAWDQVPKRLMVNNRVGKTDHFIS